MANESDGIRSSRQRVREAADVCHQLIAVLSSSGHTIELRDQRAVSQAIATEGGFETGDFNESDFWNSFARIASLLPPGQDPYGVYFSTLYSFGHTDSSPHSTKTRAKYISNNMKRITNWSVFVLLFLIVLLAYSTIVKSAASLLNDYKIEAEAALLNDWHMTRYADEVGVDFLCYYDIPDQTTVECREMRENIYNDRDRLAVSLNNWLFWSKREAAIDKQVVAEVLLRSQQLFMVLDRYVLPLVAGILGAFFSLLRGASLAVDRRELHPRFFSTAYLKIAMGAVSGIIVGWLSVGDQIVEGLAVGPLALAFTAGYAVEILLTLLDRVVGAFTVSRSEPSTPLTLRPPEVSSRENNPPTGAALG